MAHAQLPPITEAPPKIQFEPWIAGRANDISRSFSASFPSAVVTATPENNTVYVEASLPADQLNPVPTVIILHYWGATDYLVERRMVAQLNRRGIGCVLMTLPFHMRRSPRGVSSGQLAVRPDPAALRETMVQATQDVRRTIDWMETHPEFRRGAIGISGTSLGAIVAASASAVEPRIGPQCYLIGGVDLAHIVWRSSRVVAVRDELRRQGYTEDGLRRELASVEPEPLLKASAPRPALVVRAQFDTIIPGQSADRLIAALSNPAVERMDTGHFGGVLIARPILRSQTEFFASAFAGVGYRPRNLRAPTLRFGASLTPNQGLEVFGGVNLLGDPAGANLSLQLSPRNISLYPNFQLSKSVSIGVAVGPKQPVRPRLSWSFVL